MGYTWPYLVKLDYTWLNTLARSLTCGPPSNRPHAFLRQTRNGLGFIENQEHVFCSQIESKDFKNRGLILCACFVQCSLFFMLWALQLNMHRVGYKCETIHESGNWGIFEKNINTKFMSWKIWGKFMINRSTEFRIEEIWRNSWKIKTSLHSERRRRLCIFEDLLQNPQLPQNTQKPSFLQRGLENSNPSSKFWGQGRISEDAMPREWGKF